MGLQFKFKKHVFQTINAEEGVEKREPSYTVSGNVTDAVTVENSMEFP